MLKVTAVARGPLFIGAGREQGNLIPGLPIVPGSVLRGALANAWITSHGPPTPGDPDFTRTFDGQVRYGPLVPQKPTQAVLEPMSVLRCRRAEHHVVDQLHDRLAATPSACPICGGQLDRGKGRWLGARQDAFTRVELEDDETTREGQLFTRESIPRGTSLTGYITNPAPWLEELAADADPLDVWLGGRKTVAGHTELHLTDVGDLAPAPRPDGDLALVLRSPGVFVDNLTRPYLGFPLDEVEERLRLPAGSTRITAQWLRTLKVTGWHTASGMPKPEDYALAPGSATLIQVDTEPSAERLAALARNGLGLRRAEGMGWVEVNPPRWEAPVSDSSAPTDGTLPLVIAFRKVLDQSGLDSDGKERLVAWLADSLREQAERAEVGRPNEADDIIALRRELRQAGDGLRSAARELVTPDPSTNVHVAAAVLRERADQLQGAR